MQHALLGKPRTILVPDTQGSLAPLGPRERASGPLASVHEESSSS
jgi:hypothetical protein